MSWSLQISNGDLVLGSGGLATATGGNKLVQDLGCAILEPMGTDPLHRTYGSVIDGGIDANGNVQTGVIGNPNDSTAGLLVNAEVQRLCKNYQAQQIARNNLDLAIYGRSTLTADEALLGVSNITLTAAQDNLLVTATVQTGTGSLPLAQPFSSA